MTANRGALARVHAPGRRNGRIKPVLLDERQRLLVRRHAGARLRRAGIPDLAEFEPHGLTWADLNARERDISRIARGIADSITEEMPPEHMRDLEGAFDALMLAIDEIGTEKNARTELGDRRPRGEGGSPRRPIGEAAEARCDGGGTRRLDEPEVTVGLRPEQRMSQWAMERGVEHHAGLTLGRYLRSMVLGARNDVERRALTEGTDSAGGYTVPEILSAQLIDLLRARTIAIRAGARTVPLTSDFNSVSKVATDPVPAWRAEAAAVAESDPTFDRITFMARSLAVLVKVSRELLDDSLNLETELPRVLAAAMAVELDRVAFFGSGTPPEPTGIVNVTGIGEATNARR